MTARTRKEIKEALGARDPIFRDFFLGRITAAERERRLAQLEKKEGSR